MMNDNATTLTTYLSAFLHNATHSPTDITPTVTLLLGGVGVGKTTIVQQFFKDSTNYDAWWLDNTVSRNESSIYKFSQPLAKSNALSLLWGQRRRIVAVLDDINDMVHTDTTGFYALLKMIRGRKNQIPVILIGTTIDNTNGCLPVHDMLQHAISVSVSNVIQKDALSFLFAPSAPSFLFAPILKETATVTPMVTDGTVVAQMRSTSTGRPDGCYLESDALFYMYQCRRWKCSKHDLQRIATEVVGTAMFNTKRCLVATWCKHPDIQELDISAADEKNISTLIKMMTTNKNATVDDTLKETSVPIKKKSDVKVLKKRGPKLKIDCIDDTPVVLKRRKKTYDY